jgi:hypothetical protein
MESAKSQRLMETLGWEFKIEFLALRFRTRK